MVTPVSATYIAAIMESYTNDAEPQADAVLSVDRTVSYFLVALGIFLGFLLILSTFLQVNRVTTKPSKAASPRFGVAAGSPEIGTIRNSRSR